jgi:two-component system response regulator HydG
MSRILLIEDDVAFCNLLERFLTKHNYQVTTAYSAAEAREKLDVGFDLVITDLRLPDIDGINMMTEIKGLYPDTPVILMTGYSDVNTAVKAMRRGAFDYISKPFNPEEVLLVVKSALSTEASPAPVAADPDDDFVQGQSEVSSKLAEYIRLVGPTDISVLITGESGTGKEVIANKIHKAGARKNKKFIAVDCGTIPADLAASEFFGHLKGSFTGALADKIGYFEAANGGTLFLDEIGNLSYENQIKLLRALQERRVKPVGSNKEIAVDIRIIAATNEDLREAVKHGDFREDLYHRINEFEIHSPPLRQRQEDLIAFAEHFLTLANIQLNKQCVGFSTEVLSALQRYSWPGNLRELKNVIKRAVLLSSGDVIGISALPLEIINPEPQKGMSLQENERDAILEALAKAGNNKTKAAQLLNITRKTLYNKLNQYGLDY